MTVSDLGPPNASLTVWPTLRDVDGGELVSIPWGEAFDQFDNLGQEAFKGDREHPGWSPAVFRPLHRAAANVQSVSALVLDYDGGTTLEAAREMFGVFFGYIHTTRKHTDSAHRFRVVLPLSREVSPAEYERLWRSVVLTAGHRVDEACKDVSRFWYLPGPLQGNPFWSERLTGSVLEPDWLLADPAPQVSPPVERMSYREGSREERYVQAALDKECSNVASAPIGARNDTLNRAAHSIGTLVGAGYVSEEAALGRLLEAAHACGLKAFEARKTARSGLVAGMKKPRQVPKSEPTAEQPATSQVTKASEQSAPQRAEVIVTDLHEMVPQVIRLLAPLEIYQRSGGLVHVTREAASDEAGIIRPAGTPRIRPLRPAVLALRMTEAARFKKLKTTKGGVELVDCRVPQDVVQAVHDLGEWEHIRPLKGVIDYPVLRPDGSLLRERGYDVATGLICEPSIDVCVPERPTLKDAERAVRRLVDDVLPDFPFESQSHASAWVCALLTVLGRPAIVGPVPAFLFDANEQGSGKTLLAELVSLIALGRAPTSRPTPKDNAEWNKSLLSVAQAGDALMLFDNVKGKIDSDALEAAITSTTFGGRELGVIGDLALPWRCVVMLTANNATLSTDLVRRTLHVRLTSKTERPSERTGFKHPNLKTYVIEQRAELLSAALTILRAYVVAGRPDVGLRSMGSFEAWSEFVRNAMVWAECPDPVETQQALREAADTDRSALEALLTAWFRRYGNRPVTTSQLLTDAEHGSRPEDKELKEAIIGYCDDKDALPSSKKLGKALGKDRQRIAGSVVLLSGIKGKAGIPWMVQSTGTGDFVTLGDFLPVPREEKNQSHLTRIGLPESHPKSQSHFGFDAGYAE